MDQSKKVSLQTSASKSAYIEKLKDPRWQKKRLEIFDRDEWGCQSAGLTNETLHVHHLRYFNSDPWNIENCYLITLCSHCHEIETEASNSDQQDLINVLKSKGFLSHNFNDLCKVFIGIEHGWAKGYPSIEILQQALINPDIWQIMSDRYFDSINKNRK